MNTVQQEYSFYIRQAGSNLALQLPRCYADDSHIHCFYLEAVQRTNDFTSAFAAIFGIKYAPHKARTISTCQNRLRDRFPRISLVFSRRHASLMDKALLQKTSSTQQILFSSFTGAQQDLLSTILVRPLRRSRSIGRRLATLTNLSLGGFCLDIDDLVLRAKRSLFDAAIAEGGATAASMKDMVLRELQRCYRDPTVVHGSFSVLT